MHQRDIDENSFNIMTFGIVVPKPARFSLPSSYLAFTVFYDDIRVHVDGTQWLNDGTWKPTTDSSSSIEIFPYSAACRAANIILPSATREFQPQPSTSKSSTCGSAQNLSKVQRPRAKGGPSQISGAKTKPHGQILSRPSQMCHRQTVSVCLT